MIPTNAVVDATMDLLAADATLFAPPALANHVHLILAPFNPTRGTDFTVLTPATFTGSGALSCGLGAQTTYTDPLSGDRVMLLKDPAGGWRWSCTVTPAPAQTVAGYCVTDNADLVTLGSGKLDGGIDVIINAAGQGIVIGEIDLRLPRSTFG